MPKFRRPTLLIAVAAAALAGGLLACTAQDPPSPAPAPAPAPGPGQPAGGAAGEPATDPGTAAAGSPLADPNFAQKAKLGLGLAQARCTICHKIDGKGGVLSIPLEQATAERFVKMASYGEHVAALKSKDPARYNASKKVFDEIEAEPDRHRRVMRWLKAYLAKPTFDNGQAKMLPQSLTPEQMEQLLAYLLTLEPKPAEPKAAEGR